MYYVRCTNSLTPHEGGATASLQAGVRAPHHVLQGSPHRRLMRLRAFRALCEVPVLGAEMQKKSSNLPGCRQDAFSVLCISKSQRVS